MTHSLQKISSWWNFPPSQFHVKNFWNSEIFLQSNCQKSQVSENFLIEIIMLYSITDHADCVCWDICNLPAVGNLCGENVIFAGIMSVYFIMVLHHISIKDWQSKVSSRRHHYAWGNNLWSDRSCTIGSLIQVQMPIM